MLEVFPLNQIADVGAPGSKDAKLISVKLFSKNTNLCDHGT